MLNNIENVLKSYQCGIYVQINKFQDSHPVNSACSFVKASKEGFLDTFIKIGSEKWKVSCATELLEGLKNVVDINAAFEIANGESDDSNAALKLQFDSWSKDNYILMPAAVYNGNRFDSRKTDYPPQFSRECDLKADIPTIITDVPRLNIFEGLSQIQLLTGDMSTPSIGFFNPSTRKGFWLLTDQATILGNSGIAIMENEDKSSAEIIISAPNTAGSVYANIQNKHSAPGICTLSGDSIFKLYRATGDKKYLDLLKEIAHNMPQYLSREDKPIFAWNNNIGAGDGSWLNMPEGWMCERVNMSDWLEPVGEIFYGSCWCEVSNMLTYVEVPGLYIQPDIGFICNIDHIDAKIVDNNREFIEVEIKNPTSYNANVKVFTENTSQMSGILGQNWLLNCMRLTIEGGQSYVWRKYK